MYFITVTMTLLWSRMKTYASASMGVCHFPNSSRVYVGPYGTLIVWNSLIC